MWSPVAQNGLYSNEAMSNCKSVSRGEQAKSALLRWLYKPQRTPASTVLLQMCGRGPAHSGKL